MHPSSQNLDKHLGDQDNTDYYSQDSPNTSFYSIGSQNEYHSFASLTSIPKLLEDMNASSGREREVLQDLNQSQSNYYSILTEKEQNYQLNYRNVDPAKRLKNLMVKELHGPSNRSSSKEPSEEFTLGPKSHLNSPSAKADTPELNCTAEQDFNQISLIPHDQGTNLESARFFGSLRDSVKNQRDSCNSQENNKEVKKELNSEIDTRNSFQKAGGFNRTGGVTISNTQGNENSTNVVVVHDENVNKLTVQGDYGSHIDYKLKNYYQNKSELIAQTLEKYKNQPQFKDQGLSPNLEYKAYIRSLKTGAENLDQSKNQLQSPEKVNHSQYPKEARPEDRSQEKFETPKKGEVLIHENEEGKGLNQITQHSEPIDLKEGVNVVSSKIHPEIDPKLPEKDIHQAQAKQEQENSQNLEEEKEVKTKQPIEDNNLEHQFESASKEGLVEVSQEIELNTDSNERFETATDLNLQEIITNQEQGTQPDHAHFVATEMTSDDKGLVQEFEAVQEEDGFFEAAVGRQSNSNSQQIEFSARPLKHFENEKSSMNKGSEYSKDIEINHSENLPGKEGVESNNAIDIEEEESQKTSTQNARIDREAKEEEEAKQAFFSEKTEEHNEIIVNQESPLEHDPQEIRSSNVQIFEAERRTGKTSPEKEHPESKAYQTLSSTPYKGPLSAEQQDIQLSHNDEEEESSSNLKPFENKGIESVKEEGKTRETIIGLSDAVHNLEANSIYSHDGKEDSPETHKVQPFEVPIEDNQKQFEKPSLQENNPSIVNHHRKISSKDYYQTNEVLPKPPQDSKVTQETHETQQIQTPLETQIVQQTHVSETINTQTNDQIFVEISQKDQLKTHSKPKTIETNDPLSTFDVKKEVATHSEYREYTDIAHPPYTHIDEEYPPPNVSEDPQQRIQTESFHTANPASPDKEHQHSSEQKPQEMKHDSRNNSLHSSPPHLTQSEIQYIIATSIKSESRENSLHKIKSSSKSPEKHEDPEVALQESFHKFYEHKKREMMHQVPSFDERMKTDIEFRRLEESALEKILQETKMKISPEAKEELYQRLAEDAQHWNERRQIKNAKRVRIEEGDQSANSKAKERTDRQEAVQNYTDRLQKDSNRRSVLVKERERLKIEIENLIVEKLQTTPTSRSADDVMKVISRLWEDANTCRLTKEKIIFMKVAEEMRLAYEHANERIKGGEGSKTQQTSASKTFSTIPNSPQVMRSVSPKTETRITSRLSPDSTVFHSTHTSHFEEVTRVKSPESLSGKISARKVEVKDFSEKEKTPSLQKYPRGQSRDRRIETVSTSSQKHQSAVRSPQPTSEKIEHKTSQMEQSDLQRKLIREKSPQRSGASSIQSSETKNKSSPVAKLKGKKKSEGVQSPVGKAIQLSKELSEKYQYILKENPFVKRKGHK